MADLYEVKPRKTIEQANLWFSEWHNGWITCTWIVLKHDTYTNKKTYERERVTHPTFADAVKHLAQNYKGVSL